MLHRIASRVRPFRGWFLLLVLATASCLGIVFLASLREPLGGPATVVNACGSTIDVRFDGETRVVTRADLLAWIGRASDAVCTYYGRFPVPHLNLDVRVRGRAGVHGGVTYPYNGGFIDISVGKRTAVVQLNEDSIRNQVGPQEEAASRVLQTIATLAKTEAALENPYNFAVCFPHRIRHASAIRIHCGCDRGVPHQCRQASLANRQ